MNIIVTGASQGIGRECVLKFSENPENRVIAIARNKEKLSELRSQAIHDNISIYDFDLSEHDLTKLSDFISEFKTIDILINNAGLLISKPFEELTNDDWQQMYETNIFGPARLIKTLLPFLGKSSKSHIVNISSMGGFQGSMKFPGLAAYSSSKAAIANLTELLALEFENKNISVNCLAIGAVQTEMLSKRFPDFKAPLSSSEMADYVVDFSINGHKYYNGKILPVALSTP
jgi:3-oxoacyl-[acyl-carrier protein] reductase